MRTYLGFLAMSCVWFGVGVLVGVWGAEPIQTQLRVCEPVTCPAADAVCELPSLLDEGGGDLEGAEPGSLPVPRNGDRI